MGLRRGLPKDPKLRKGDTGIEGNRQNCAIQRLMQLHLAQAITARKGVARKTLTKKIFWGGAIH